eukprot:s163_g20.t1
MERRRDPYDGKTQTLQEMVKKYQGTYSKPEVESYFEFECTAVASVPASSASAPAPKPAKVNEIEGLRQWLKEKGRERQFDQVSSWCEENGAVLLEEVQENWDDILQELKDLPAEKAADLPSIAGLEEWLEEIELEEYLEDVLEWCQENHVKLLKHIQAKWDDILQDLKLKTAKAELPGKKDDFEETLPLDALGGGKYLLEPVDSDEEEEETAQVKDLLWKGRLSVEIGSGAGLDMRWVKLGYAVDKVSPTPGQKDLSPGDVILWINGMFLIGFDEDTVTDRFAEAFANGAPLVVGKLSSLMKHELQEAGNWRFRSGVISQMLVFRRAFESAEIRSFDDFLHNVSTTRLAAPFYIVAAGVAPGQGVAVARNLLGSDGTDWLPKDEAWPWPNGQRDQTQSLARPALLEIDALRCLWSVYFAENPCCTEDFYLCQCNTDRWLPDDVEDPRRTAAETLLQRLGREEASVTGLFAVVSAYPVHNPHTAYTAVMSAATGEFHAYVREASCPVDPYASVVLDRRYCLKNPQNVVISV